MVDISAIAGAMNSIRASFDIAKAMKDIHDASVIQSKVVDLTREIMNAQSCAIGAQLAQSAMVEEIAKLKKELASRADWDAQKERYQLKDYGGGTFAYEL
jgi:hypothetical protein